MKRLPRNYVVAALTRWGAWLLVLLLLWNNGTFAQLGNPPHAVSLMLLSYITIYALLWTRLLPRIITRTNDGSVVILYDLMLSALPLWHGGWASPFLPFALSVLVVPAISRGWRGGLLVAAIFLALDQIILWTTTPNPWDLAFSEQSVIFFGETVLIQGSLALVFRTLLPFGLVAFVVTAVAAGQRYKVRSVDRTKRSLPKPRAEHPTVRAMLDDPADTLPSYTRAQPTERPLEQPWSKERASQPTLERRSSTTIRGALHHLRAELATAGIVLTVHMDGDEAGLPLKVQALLTKAVEVALDNVIGHSRARSVAVNLQIGYEAVILSICDDGIGLYDGTAEPPGFHQLKRLRFRAQEIGGKLRVEERPEGGVQFQLHVPITL